MSDQESASTLKSQLQDMGFAPELAEPAATAAAASGMGLELAFELIEQADNDPVRLKEIVTQMSQHQAVTAESLQPQSLFDNVAGFLSNTAQMKAVFVVPRGQNLSAGKLSAQVGHAALGLMRQNLNQFGQTNEKWNRWVGQGEKMVVLETESGPKSEVSESNPQTEAITAAQTELDRLCALARQNGIPTSEIRDAGRTEVVAGTRTVLAIGPGSEDEINLVTGKLGLLK